MNRITNEQKYTTTKDRIMAFNKRCVPCRVVNCDRVQAINCYNRWLTSPSDEEKPMQCPFCGGKCVCTNEWNSKFRVVCHEKEDCWYSSSLYGTREEAIAAHNRVARAVMAAKKGE